MQADKTQQSYVYSEAELAKYRNCPELLFVGGHSSGFVSCPYCASVFRSFRRLQNEEALPEKQQEAVEEEEEEREAPAAGKQKTLDDNGECTKLMCMKAGWCMCE